MLEEAKKETTFRQETLKFSDFAFDWDAQVIKVDFSLFFCGAQSDTEKLKGLPVTPFMDRDKVSKPSSQTNFIRFVLLPLFTELTKLFPCLEVKYHSCFTLYDTIQTKWSILLMDLTLYWALLTKSYMFYNVVLFWKSSTGSMKST